LSPSCASPSTRDGSLYSVYNESRLLRAVFKLLGYMHVATQTSRDQIKLPPPRGRGPYALRRLYPCLPSFPRAHYAGRGAWVCAGGASALGRPHGAPVTKANFTSESRARAIFGGRPGFLLCRARRLPRGSAAARAPRQTHTHTRTYRPSVSFLAGIPRSDRWQLGRVEGAQGALWRTRPRRLWCARRSATMWARTHPRSLRTASTCDRAPRSAHPVSTLTRAGGLPSQAVVSMCGQRRACG
jgi:hypothetical protein